METGVLVCFFKPTRFACGETRRYYFATLNTVAPSRRVSSRVPTLQGLMQTKADNTGPTKPDLCLTARQ